MPCDYPIWVQKICADSESNATLAHSGTSKIMKIKIIGMAGETLPAWIAVLLMVGSGNTDASVGQRSVFR